MRKSGLKQEAACVVVARYFLVGVNLLTGSAGLLLLTGGIYLWIEYENQFSGLLSAEAIMGVLISGACLFLLTVMGIYGAVSGKRTWLTIYLFGICLLLSLEVILALIFLQYLDLIERNDETESTQLEDQAVVFINNFIFRTYSTCCVGDESNCNQFQEDPGPLLFCAPVGFCANETLAEFGCVLDDSEEPSLSIEKGVCSALGEFFLDDEPIVGPTSADNTISCGGGVPAVFESVISDWLTENINFFGYGALIVGVLELLIVMFAVGLLLTKPEMIMAASVVNENDLGVDASRISVAIPVASHRSQRIRSTRSGASGGSSAGPRPMSMSSNRSPTRPVSSRSAVAISSRPRPASTRSARARPVSTNSTLRTRPLSTNSTSRPRPTSSRSTSRPVLVAEEREMRRRERESRRLERESSRLEESKQAAAKREARRSARRKERDREQKEAQRSARRQEHEAQQRDSTTSVEEEPLSRRRSAGYIDERSQRLRRSVGRENQSTIAEEEDLVLNAPRPSKQEVVPASQPQSSSVETSAPQKTRQEAHREEEDKEEEERQSLVLATEPTIKQEHALVEPIVTSSSIEEQEGDAPKPAAQVILESPRAENEIVTVQDSSPTNSDEDFFASDTE